MRRGEREFRWFVGIDWGTAVNEVRVLDAQGADLGQHRVAESREGFTRLLEVLQRVSEGHLERVAVAIEKPRGALVETLLERGCGVFALNPKQLDRFRDRFSVAGAKDDPLDALVLASAVRTDRGCFRAVAIDAPLVIRLRELARAEAVVTDEVVAVTNRLRDLIQRIAPAWLTLSTNADDPWFWSLLELVATPQLGRGLRRRVLTALLERHRIRKWDVDAVFAALEVEPLPVAPGTVDAVTAHIRLLLPRVQLLAEQQKACRRGLEALLDEYAASDDTAAPPSPPAGPTTGAAAAPPPPDDVTILRSLPGVGTLIATTLLTDAGSAVAERDYPTLRATAGVAPVRRQTGKNKRGTITMRRACNRRLRQACYHWASGSQRLDAAAKAYYATLRQRGHTHGRALRSLADRWLRILMAMLKTRTLYDARRFARATTM